MYKIGEFSKITMLSIKTLRYYDKEEMLVPDFRDENGYRYYSENNFKQAQMIFMLRQLDFSISEIKEVLANCEDSGDIHYYLNDKKEIIKREIEDKKNLINKIDSYINKDNNKKENKNMYKFSEKEVNGIKVIGKRFKGSVKNSGNIISNLYKCAKAKVNGDMFTLYYDMEDKENSDIEICIPVKEYVSGDHEFHTIEGSNVLSTTHTGTYETLNLAYKSIIDYAKENDIELGFPIRETYIKGPGMIFKGNPEKYITEIAFPIIDKK